jgi:hypothetical protein
MHKTQKYISAIHALTIFENEDGKFKNAPFREHRVAFAGVDFALISHVGVRQRIPARKTGE